MKVAIWGDVHSNIVALQTVIQDMIAKKADIILGAGDLVGYCPFPNEVIEFCRAYNLLSVKGNYDDSVGHDRLVCGCDYKDDFMTELAMQSIGFTRKVTTEENKEYLRGLPSEIALQINGKKMVVVHGSSRRMNEYMHEDAPQTLAVMSETDADILVCAHTHHPYTKVYNGKTIVNVGSAGKPKHGNPDAVYALLTFTADGFDVSFVYVPYDYEQTARAIEESVLPNYFAELIRTGKG